MQSFRYLARDEFGVLQAGNMQSDGREDALAQLDKGGFFLLELEEEQRREDRRREDRRREERRREDRRNEEERKQGERRHDRRTQDRRMFDRRVYDRRIQDRGMEERRTVFGLADHVLTARHDVDVEGPVLSHG